MVFPESWLISESELLKNSPGLAQGVSDHWLFVLETTIEQRLLHFLFFFCNCCCFFVKLLNNSLTRGGAFREPLDPSSGWRFAFRGPFFVSVFLHPLFHHKITFVTKLVPKKVPKSLPNLTLDLFFLIFWKPCFGTTLHCF